MCRSVHPVAPPRALPPPPLRVAPLPLSDDEEDEEDEEDDVLYSRKLEAGLFTLQHVDAVVATLATCTNATVGLGHLHLVLCLSPTPPRPSHTVFLHGLAWSSPVAPHLRHAHLSALGACSLCP